MKVLFPEPVFPSKRISIKAGFSGKSSIIISTFFPLEFIKEKLSPNSL